jgi:Tfp pilus assembly protein PilF
VTTSNVALPLLVALAVACGGSSSEGPRRPRGPKVVATPKLPPADPDAVRDMDAALRALERGGPDAGERALERLRVAVKKDPRLWEAWHDLGVVQFSEGDDDAAAGAFSRALAVNPAHTPSLKARAEALRRAGEKKKARADYKEVLERSPNDVQAYARMASLLREMGELEDAVDLLRDALRAVGGRAPIYVELGLVYLAQGRDDLAELVLSKAAQLDEKNPDIWNALAMVAMERGRDQEAFERFDKASALAPDFLDARFNVASVLIDAGDYARARSELEAVVAKRPDDLGARVALGVAHRGLGEQDRARAIWQDVVKAAPRHSAVRGDALFNLAVLEQDFAMNEKKARAALDRFLQESPRNHPKRAEAEERRKELGQ